MYMSYVSLKEALIQNYHKHFEVVTVDQVGAAIYYQWLGLMNAFYMACEKADKWLDTNREWESVDEVLKSEEYQEVYEIFKGMLELIGEVSGASLLYGKHFSLFPSAAYFKAKSAERETHGRKSRFDFFREICEMSVSRQVVIQDLIGAQILEEELEERELIRRYKRKKSRQKARRAEAIKRELASKPRNISFTTFVVLCNVFKCEKEHHIEAVRALIEILLPNGSTSTEEISAGYCKECKKYFILEHDYKAVREKGVLLCRMINENGYKQQNSTENPFSDLKPESLLHQCGYNVKAIDNLTTDQRQGILRRVIDNDLYTINGVLGFLDWLIDCNKNNGKRDMSIAIAKWRLDREYVAEYQKDLQRKVKAKGIDLRRKAGSRLRVGDTVYPKTMITYSNKQHMFENESGIVVEIKLWKNDDTWLIGGEEEERFLAVVRSNATGELFSAFEDNWIKA